jgi:hypothetical protein
MCVTDIIEFIVDCQNGESYCNTSTFFYEDIAEVKSFSANLIAQLTENFYDDTFDVVSSTERSVEAVVFGKLHKIELESDEKEENFSWIVSIEDGEE